MKKSLLLALFSCLLMSGHAVAAEPVLGLYYAPKVIMNFNTFDGSIHVDGLGSDSTSFNEISFGGALAMGYDFDVLCNMPVRTEIEFAMFSDIDATGFPYTVPTNGEIGINTLMLNAFYDFKNNSDFTPYVGVGAGIAWVSMKGDIAGAVGFASHTENNFAWNLTAGVAYEITENWSADLGYRYLNAGDAKTESTTIAGVTGHLEAKDIASHQIMLGVRYTY
ncbi:MAG: outer membrane beta-barrel protein [Pseudomonadota bacterium]